ncbi:hypothetical protein [Clostridium novyi]
MLKSIKEYDEIARGDVTIFLEEFEKIKQYIIDNPDKLYRRGW